MGEHPPDQPQNPLHEDYAWENSAQAWITEMGEADQGDYSRRYVLDPVLLPRAVALLAEAAASSQPPALLDIGCGEGRFCRLVRRAWQQQPTASPLNTAPPLCVVGLDPTPTLLATARQRDPAGHYLRAAAEHLPFPDASFPLAVSYLTLIDIDGYAEAILEAARILRPGGTLLVANLNGFNTAASPGWVRARTKLGNSDDRLHFAFDHYLTPRPTALNYRGIRVINHHRPLSHYMQAFLAAGLRLTHFSEPAPIEGAPEPKATRYRRSPNFHILEWRKA